MDGKTMRMLAIRSRIVAALLTVFFSGTLAVRIPLSEDAQMVARPLLVFVLFIVSNLASPAPS